MIAEARQWESLSGKAQVIGTATVRGQMVFLVKYGDIEFPSIVKPDEIDSLIENDEQRLKSRKLARMKSEDSAISSYVSLNEKVEEYANNFPPMRKAKIKSSLSKLVRSEGNILSRSDLIEQMVKEGANVTLISGTKVLQTTSGSYIEQSRLTKTGIDYAEFLLGSI